MSEFSVLWIIMDTAYFFHVTETMGFSSAIIQMNTASKLVGSHLTKKLWVFIQKEGKN